MLHLNGGSKGFEAKVEAPSALQDVAPDPEEGTSSSSAEIEISTLRMHDVTQFSGGYVGGVTPVPIPNTEVKPSRADGTPRETAWESRSLPDFF